ncbi:MAG TPA: hypothetical protein VGP61_06780, partial [Gemmatimonadales bacterium]|nr:hypothetical protein [Gemmatimonadales bacterium]
MTVTGDRLAVSGGLRAALVVVGMLMGAGALRAQDTSQVQMIHPEARPDSTRPVLPAAVLRDVLNAWNDSATTRIAGSFMLPSGARLVGSVATFYGSIRVAGELIGKATVINGDLVLESGGLVRGEVLVVGGRIMVRPGGRLEGGPHRSYPIQAQLLRTPAGTLVVRPPPRRLGELATAAASFPVGPLKTTLSIETGRTYNRVEGLPIVFGPTLVREGLPNLDERLDLRGIAWTAPDRTDRRADFGYSAQLQFRFGTARRLTLRGQVYRVISSTEEQPLSAMEAGWSAFLFQRDYRDYYQAEGVRGFASYLVGHGLTLSTSLRRESEKSVPAGDPISVFRNEAWRPNPLVDDGHYVSWRLGADFDTRNDPEAASSGWLVRGWWERSRSDDAAPLAFPSEVRDPIPPGRYAFSYVRLDARRYARFSPSLRTSVRLLAAGWVSGDPLPVQRRLSVGGPDLLPGHAFRVQNCAPAALADPARPALCDRLIALQ